jgi:DNA-directed RNA polymerase specialized sigma24 family protein
MGSCKVDIYQEDRRFAQEYDFSSPAGVTSALNEWPRICAAAAASNFAAIDAIVDVAVAIEETLSAQERDFVELVYFDGWDIDEVAGICDVDVAVVQSSIERAAERIANYLGGTEGYEHGV